MTISAAPTVAREVDGPMSAERYALFRSSALCQRTLPD